LYWRELRGELPPLHSKRITAAIGMDWKLHIAYRDTTDDGVVILGPLDSGPLGSVMAFFKLFEKATVLAK
jgi:hypothetical protein